VSFADEPVGDMETDLTGPEDDDVHNPVSDEPRTSASNRQAFARDRERVLPRQRGVVTIPAHRLLSLRTIRLASRRGAVTFQLIDAWT
jgi:hypothetical protein